MNLGESTVKRLEIDDDLREAIGRARTIGPAVARRRAERTLAGDLRRFDLVEVEAQITKLQDGNPDVQQFHLAEQWRTRLVEEGPAAIPEFPGGPDNEELPRLIAAAQREKTTGRPPGASRALFRHIAEQLKAHEPPKGENENENEESEDELPEDEPSE